MAWARVVQFRAAVEGRAERIPDPSTFAWTPDAGLARLGIDARQAAYVFACVAATVDPLLVPHLITVAGVDGRRGLSPMAYATLVGLTELDAIALTTWLASEPPIVRLHLLERDGDDYLASATPYRATSRLVKHLTGDLEVAPLRPATRCMTTPSARPSPRSGAVSQVIAW